ncbi:DUF2306 domain-containing protein [Meiothermus granaticius]|uniref:Membrane protein (DUF2306) n=1 Tax=Meiothermus granaticius NBRC 107808 TaxID=1227551 RepID=A0A399F7C3_9DEIN|nr:DUF2306 domain-containing protein [Meiothermus granaticius]RIH91625.1 hypothetical protein Mgrana_02435 [Meiothermus granaticius NBRC 107808]GEM88504.1 membrane protein [Meiothermus granaticius NBRC 107808]
MSKIPPKKSLEWMIPTALLVLSLVPTVAGAVRVIQLGTGVEITPDNARFFDAPVPVLLHIAGATVYSLLGAFQFAPSFRRFRPGLHRAAGRLLIPSGLVAAPSGLWMAHFYPWPELDGEILYGLRLLFGTAMTLSLVMGALAIYQRNFVRHGAWMMRAYAIGLGAGTQVFTHIPLALFPEALNEGTRALAMGAGWVINLVVAEWVIRRRLQAKPKRAIA